MTPGRAIRAHCVECVGGAHEMKDCQGDKPLAGPPCPLFPFRMGKGRPSVRKSPVFGLGFSFSGRPRKAPLEEIPYTILTLEPLTRKGSSEEEP